MVLHKEGKNIIAISTAGYLLIIWMAVWYMSSAIAALTITLFSILYVLILRFFRVPKRTIKIDNQTVLSPCDGKIVIIKEVEEPEYFQDKRLQISVFMSPLNVHVNWYPVNGETTFFKYHPGKYLVAYHPKSSTLNERTTTVIKTPSGIEVLFRQIAGAVARRIVPYAKVGKEVRQDEEMGFIKFGSRMDVFLPLDTKVRVRLGEKVVGTQTVLAELNDK